MDALTQDIRQAWRSLTRSRALALTAVLVMALGSGATTAVVSLLDELSLRPLDLPRPSELHLGGMRSSDGLNSSFSWPEFRDLEAATPQGAQVAVYSSLTAVLAGGPEARHAWGDQVSGGFHELLGARAERGRMLSVADDIEGAERVLVLSHGAWVRSFGSDPTIVGRTLRLNRVPYRVVGVAERSFHGITRGFHPEYWIPVSTASAVTGDDEALTSRRSRWLMLVARVAAPQTTEAVAARLQAEEEALGRDGRDRAVREGRFGFLAASAGDTGMLGGSARLAMVLGVLVVLLLALAVANLAGLLLARGSVRQREMGVRLALGAPRGRLVRQLLVEGLLLAVVGGLAGLLIAGPLVHLLVGFIPVSYTPLSIEPRLDARVLAALTAVLALTGMGVALAPALEAGRTDLNSAIRDGASPGWWPGRRFSLRSALVVAQVALSFVLLVSAGLFARSLWQEAQVNPGFETRGRWALTLDTGGLDRSTEAREAFASALLERVRALPGVTDATLVNFLQPQPGGNRMGYSDGDLGIAGLGEIEFDVNQVGPRYFATLGVPLVAGREFDHAEGTSARRPTVVAVNRALAKRLFQDANPLGRTLWMEGPGGPVSTVVAVVPDLPLRSLRDTGRPCAYVPGPLAQTPNPVLIVHARDGVQPLTAMSVAARQVSPEVATSEPVSFEQRLGETLATARMTTWLMAAFACVALLLAGLGLYGLLAHAVARRRREIGVRIALGADTAGIVRLVAGGGLRLVVVGLVLGAAAAFLLGRAVSGLLYRVPAFDTLAWALALTALGVAAVLAAGLPARAAALVQPAEALRQD